MCVCVWVCVGEVRCIRTGFWQDNLREIDHLNGLVVDGRIILNGCSRSGKERLYVSGQGQVAGSCECGNELSGCTKCGEFLD